jgi:tetratricopeptide (TPR) repeat protein
MADRYIAEKFQNLPIEMDTKLDSLQAALNLYNNGKPEDALKQLENLAIHDLSSADAKKYAGIVSLQLGQYEKAINYFSQLSAYTLHANPGKFYHALTLMKRNQPGDLETAKQLLQQVVDQDLDKKKEAEKWLKKW